MRTFKASAVALCLDTIPTDAALEECPSQRGSFLTSILQSLGDRGFLFFFAQNSQKHVQTSCFSVLCGGWCSASPIQPIDKMLIYSLGQISILLRRWLQQLSCSLSSFLLPWVHKDFLDCLPKWSSTLWGSCKERQCVSDCCFSPCPFGHYCKTIFARLWMQVGPHCRVSDDFVWKLR